MNRRSYNHYSDVLCTTASKIVFYFIKKLQHFSHVLLFSMCRFYIYTGESGASPLLTRLIFSKHS